MKRSVTVLAVLLALCASAFTQPARAAAETTTLGSGEIVASQAALAPDGGSFETLKAVVHLYYGEYGGETYEFADVRGGGTGLGSKETYGLSNYTSAHINENLMRVSIRYGLIFRFRFKEDMLFSVEHAAGTLNSTSRKLTVTQYLSDGENEIVLAALELPERSGTIEVAENAMAVSAHVKAGDVFTMTLESKKYDGLTLNGALPRFRFDPAGYDGEQRYDFAALKAYKAEVTAVIQRLQAYYDGLDQQLYSFDNRLLLIDILDRALGACRTLTPETDLAAFESGEKEKLDAVPTLEEEAAALTAFKTEKAAALDALLDGIKKSDYSGKRYKEIVALVTEGKEKIDAATTTAAVTAAFNAAVAKIGEVETGGNLAPLWWSLGAVGVAAAAASVAVIWIRRKKHGKSK